MKRVAFKMKLNPGCEAEYKKRHDEIWPELAEEIKSSGLSDFSIFLDRETNILFAFHKLENDDASTEQPGKAIQRKWWAYMKDLMDTNSDDSPVTIPLVEVFHMD